MPKIQFSDVTPPEKRSIRNIPIPNNSRRKNLLNPVKTDIKSVVEPKINNSYNENYSGFESKTEDIPEKDNNSPYEYYYPKNKSVSGEIKIKNKSKKKQWFFGFSALVVIVVFIIGMMTVFSSASIEVTPRKQMVTVDNLKIEASVDSSDELIKYEILKMSKNETISVQATGEEMAEIKASGKIIVYNNYSKEPQRLIVRTRFESPEGLIYRIPESIVVPGKTVKDGVETPGSIEVQVFADEAGEKYNAKKTDFTIPGFKNDDGRYKGFYARSSTEITGGFVGKRKTVLEADKLTALEQIDASAKANLEKELSAKVPEGSVLLSGSIKYESSETTPQENGSNVILGREYTAYAFIFNKNDLSKKITTEYISKLPEWNEIGVSINNFSNLKISLPEDLDIGDKIEIQLNGTATAWANINTDIINQKLVGMPKDRAAELIDEFASISSIKAAIRPIWKTTFPKDSFRIHVKLNLDE